MAVGAVRGVVRGRGLCLPMAVVLERVLETLLPEDAFRVKLGSVHILPLDQTALPVSYDPRGPEGVDGGFHAWVEDRRGELLDPSIGITLAADGHDVDPEVLIQCAGRTFDAFERRFVYEEIENLELVGREAAEEYLATTVHVATTGGLPPGSPGVLVCPLDVRWRRYSSSAGQTHHGPRLRPRS